jgi:asparagine synthase (glutamine-hydrolysing)
MCGIVGVHYFDRARRVSPDVLRMMNDQIVHRGPDDEGQACFGHTGIGMRRLSIIDLGGGHQPIFSPSGQQAIVFNGEAFNFQERREELAKTGHQFSTHSDTEVVLHLYLAHDTDFIDYINGMFGLAIWDATKERLLIARDRLGIKPLYYYLDGEKLVYGSEIKSLLAHPDIGRSLDVDSLRLYLQYGFSPAPHTLLRGIRKLPPGHMLLTTESGVEIKKYWDVSYADKLRGSADEIAAELYDLLRSSVRYRMIADVPLGAFLSGGMDSSSIIHIMRDLGTQDISTYNIGYGSAFAEHDESSEARDIARHYGTRHHEILAEPDVRNLFPKLIRYMDEPIADSSFVVTYLVSQLARESVKVILSGVGGDELFGGYRRYFNIGLNRWWQRLPRALRQGLIAPLFAALPEDRNNRILNYVRLAKGFIRTAEQPPAQQYGAMMQVLAPGMLAPSLAASHDVLQPFTDTLADCDASGILDRIMYVDLKTSLPEQLLLLTDKMSMACSLEVRVPYLDYRVVEFAARIPEDLKIRGMQLRHIQRRTFKDRLPDAVLNRRKRGFGAPVGAWLRGELREMLEDLLSTARLERQGLFNTSQVRALVDGHMERRIDGTDGLLALLTFQLWQEEFLAL